MLANVGTQRAGLGAGRDTGLPLQADGGGSGGDGGGGGGGRYPRYRGVADGAGHAGKLNVQGVWWDHGQQWEVGVLERLQGLDTPRVDKERSRRRSSAGQARHGPRPRQHERLDRLLVDITLQLTHCCQLGSQQLLVLVLQQLLLMLNELLLLMMLKLLLLLLMLLWLMMMLLMLRSRGRRDAHQRRSDRRPADGLML